jgi:hypothetical protein
MTDPQLEALKKARAMGVITTETHGHRVTYRSLEDMDRLIAHEEAEAAGAASTRVNYTIARFCRAG